MDCRDVRDIADSFVADELLTETNHEIVRHLETCAACRRDVAERRALRQRLRVAVQQDASRAPHDDFLAALRSGLEHAAGHVPARRGAWLHGWWALAATVLLVIGVGLAYRSREWLAATGALARAAVGDHRNCALQFRLAERPISLDEAARRYGAVYRVMEQVPADTFATSSGPARVLERHMCVYAGRRFAHIVLEYRDQRVSMLVTDDDAGPPLRFPGEAHLHRTSADSVDGMSVVSLRSGRYVVFFVGDVGEAALSQLTTALAESIHRELGA